MPDTTFRQGNKPLMVDHTPSADVAMGDVVVTGDTPRICHRAIKAGELGALAATGGVYRMLGDAAIAADKKVYWNATAKRITETASGNKYFGVTITASAAANAPLDVRHSP